MQPSNELSVYKAAYAPSNRMYIYPVFGCAGSFAEITPMTKHSTDVAVTVLIAGAEADIHSEADAETVAMVFRLLKSC